ncbi:hypothetical protein B0T11DRAFT_292246 [Plectosphaerella cucumerina]|uniref:Uncharacterized protein n=1 Tax=Plectosphaerella cucumerina TaxID=40658 RepID=A0A8K0X720_9PEZI|nr:hypothetical protein B0T11DRAFT_292246 [Plectosphaerella cucumerina]
MRLYAAVCIFGLLAAKVLACDSSCPPKYNIDTCARDSSNQCVKPGSSVGRRRAIHFGREVCGDCEPKPCPEDKKLCSPPSMTLRQTEFPIRCGQKETTHTVTVALKDCNPPDTGKCLVFALSPATLELPKIEIKVAPETVLKPAPGQFTYRCESTTCSIALSKIKSGDFCGVTLWVALHTGDGRDTCWVDGTDIPGANWATQFQLNFDCAPESCCCCPPPPPPQESKKCGSETAYAKSEPPNSLSGCSGNAWGWYIKSPAPSVQAQLYAGKTTAVGSVTITKVGSDNKCFKFDYNVASGYGIGKTHINIGCDVPSEKCRAPGQYTFNSGCLATSPGTLEYCLPASVNPCASDKDIYYIIHAEVYKTVNPGDPGYDTCTPYTCS